MPDPLRNDRELVSKLIREFEAVEAIRFNWESYWHDIARRLHPNADVFQRTVLGTTQAERRTEYIFDSTPPQALESFAAVMEMMLFPRTEKWHKLVPADPRLKDNREIRAYLEEVTDILFALRYSTDANFASQAHECMKDLGAFGNTSLFVDEQLGQGIRYRAVPLQDLYFTQNHVGVIDRVFRKYAWTAQNALDEWGDKCPDVIQNAVKSNKRHQEFEFLHVVRPRDNPDRSRRDYRGMAFESSDVLVSPQTLIDEGGYRTIPYATSRYTLGPRETYGRSPGMMALADIKTLYAQSKTDLNASERMVDPPILLPEQAESFNLRPGAMNFGMVTQDGKPLAIPFHADVQPEILEEKMQKRRDMIEKAFLVPLMRTIMDHPDMTATAVLQLAQERGMLLTPTMGRQQSEFLGVIIKRELDIAAHMGILPPMPEQLIAAGGIVKIQYESMLNRLQRAPEGVAILTTIQGLMPFVEAGHPEVLDPFDFPGISRELWEINGAPAKLLLSQEQVAQIQQQKAQAANAQALVAAAPQLAAAAKDATQAHAVALNAPPTIPSGA